MNIYPNPLLCLYCDARIVPNNAEGCKNHMMKCMKHPAHAMLSRYKDLATELRRYFDSGSYDTATDLYIILQEVEKL